MATRNRTAHWPEQLLFPGIVLSCRVRLARNLAGEPLPGHASAADLERSGRPSARSSAASARLRGERSCSSRPPAPRKLQKLREEHLLSVELSERETGAALLLSEDRSLAVMVNEEDHLRIQVLRDDADLKTAWRLAEKTDGEIESRIEYAFHPTYGYLTACPSNVGTGLRVSIMLHLLGLRMTEEIEQVFRGLDQLGLAVRGVWGEGSEAAGHLYQISNQQTLGETERAILERLDAVAAETALQEQNARLRLLEDKPEVMMYCLARSLALLRSARVLHSDEALDFLCALHMGLDAGLVRNIEPELLDYWTTAVQPGHLQALAKGVLDNEARDRLRAELMHQAMAEVELAR